MEEVKRAVINYLKSVGPVVGMDPGESTGLAIVGFGQVVVSTLGFDATLGFIDTLTQQNILVVEDYVEYQSNRGGNAFNHAIPAQLIGAIKMKSRQEGFTVHLQHANSGKSSCPDDLLKMIFDVKGFTRHEKDALRHVVTFALRRVGNKIARAVQ
jgi:hypothetical protein